MITKRSALIYIINSDRGIETFFGFYIELLYGNTENFKMDILKVLLVAYLLCSICDSDKGS